MLMYPKHVSINNVLDFRLAFFLFIVTLTGGEESVEKARLMMSQASARRGGGKG